MPSSELKSKARDPLNNGKPLYSADFPRSVSNTSELDGDEFGFWDDNRSVLALNEDVASRGKLNLLERTAQFGESVIRFAKTIPATTITVPLINQFVKSGTSVGANYCEADDPLSRKDYMKSIGICRKESKETKYWLRMIAITEPGLKDDARELWREARELNLIFGAIYRKK